MSRKKSNPLEDRFDEITQVILISDDRERVKVIEQQLMARGKLTYFDPIWKRHFKYADMFKQKKRPVDPKTGEYFGKIYY